MGDQGFPVYDAKRRTWQDPDTILRVIGLRPGDVFIDVGCGDGFFSLPAARVVGEEGRVLALDASEWALGRLGERARREGLGNIELRLGWAEEEVLCSGCGDFVFFGIVLHDFRDPMRVLGNALRMLRPSGVLVDLDFRKDSPVGPPSRVKLTPEEASALIERGGFAVEEVRGVEPYSYLILARPRLEPGASESPNEP